MLHVVLLILKILGIILLSIVFLLLLVVWAVLFVSVTYRIKAEKKDALHVTAAGGWLFRTLTIRYVYDGEKEPRQELKLRLFGITIMDFFKDGEEEEKSRSQKKKKKKKPKRDAKKPADTEQAKPPPETGTVKLLSEKAAEEERTDTGTAEEPLREEREPYRASELPERIPPRQEKRRGSFIGKLRERISLFFSKIVYAFKNIRDKIRNIKEGAARLLKRKDDFLEFWNLEEHIRARRAILDELRYLWRKSRPKKIKGQVRIGFDDPSVTGVCVGALSALYAWYPGQIRIIAEFEEEVLEGDILIKGRVRLYAAVLVLIRVWFNKDIRHMYEQWQQL